MMTRTLYRSLRCLVIVFLAWLAGCSSAPVVAPDAPPAQPQSAADWLELARSAPLDERAEYQLKAAQIYHQQGQTDRADTILRSLSVAQLRGPDIHNYLALQAGIIATRSGSDAAIDWLGDSAQQALLQRNTSAQQAPTYGLLADLQARSGRYLDAVRTRIRLSAALPTEQAQGDNLEAIWHSLMQAPPAALQRGLSGEPAPGAQLRGWLQLALLTRIIEGDIDQQLFQLDQWQQQWPTHPAALSPPGEVQLLRHLAANKPASIAILLPLQGSLKEAGYAIRDGILSAYFDARERGASSSALTFYDTEANPDMAALYRRAVGDGAELIIGPLRKNRVEALLRFSDGTIPILALNYAADGLETGDNFYQLGLSSIDEARAAAQFAVQRDYQRAFIIHGADRQSTRSAAAFQQAWQELDGQTVAVVEFDSERSTSERIKQGLHIDRSQQRARQLESITGTSLEYNPRRRQDIDFVYLPVGSQQARSIKPLLAFHFAQDLPVYATSRVYRGKADPRGDADLNGVYFTDTPWALGAIPEQQRRIDDYIERGGPPSKNLYALGIDAVQLGPRIPQILYTPGIRFQGMTGELSLSADGVLLRRPSWAVFRGGIATPVEASDETLSKDAYTTQNQVQRSAGGDRGSAL